MKIRHYLLLGFIPSYFLAFCQQLVILNSGDSLNITVTSQDEEFLYFNTDGKERKISLSIVSEILQHPDLLKKLSGVKIADLGFTKEIIDLIINNANDAGTLMISGFIEYLKEDLGMEAVIVTEQQRIESFNIAESYCDYVYAGLDIENFKSEFLAVGYFPCTMRFKFCDGSEYDISFRMNVSGNTNYSKKPRKTYNKVLNYTQRYNPDERISLPSFRVVVSEEQLKKHLDTNKSNSIEGIYQLFSSSDNTSKYQLGIIKEGDSFLVVYFSGSNYNEDWKEGELKAILRPTKSNNYWYANWYDISKNEIDVSIEFPDEYTFKLNRQSADKIDVYTRLY